MAWWIAQNVALAAALAAAVAIVCRVTRIGPVVRHALWLVVLVKLVTPPLVVWPWAVPDVLGLTALETPAIDVDTVAPAAIAAPGSPTAPGISTTADRAIAPGSSIPVARGLAAAPDGRAATPLATALATAWPWLAALWIAGSVGVLSIETLRAVRLARRVRAGTPADPAIARRAAELAAALGIRPLRVVAVDGLTAPAVWSPGRPVLLWPADRAIDITDTCVDGLLVHELAHVRRRDHVVGWIELAAGVIWWWNPLFWYVRSALREQAELACDAWVISLLPHGRRAYAESLLALSGAGAPRPPAVSLAVVGMHATSRRMLERRLVMIMKGRAPIRLSTGAMLAVALVAGATLPAWAAVVAQQTTPPPSTAPRPAAVPQTTPPPSAPVPAVAPAPAAVPRTVPARTLPPSQKTAEPAVQKSVQKAVPPPGQKTVPIQVDHRYVWTVFNPNSLPADGQELMEAFEKDRIAIQEEADKKIDARRESLVKALEALQDQYAKAGKLDEAVAIRDFLRAGGPSARWAVRKR